MPGQIALPVAVDIQPPYLARARQPASFQTAVWTVCPCHATSRGSPTFTDSSWPAFLSHGGSPVTSRLQSVG